MNLYGYQRHKKGMIRSLEQTENLIKRELAKHPHDRDDKFIEEMRLKAERLSQCIRSCGNIIRHKRINKRRGF